jgi:predicted NBD/HSP70 family sugar kinase
MTPSMPSSPQADGSPCAIGLDVDGTKIAGGLLSLSERSLEDLAAGPALVEGFRAGRGDAEQGQDVLRAAAEGDPRAERIVQSASEALESQIALLVSTLGTKKLDTQPTERNL